MSEPGHPQVSRLFLDAAPLALAQFDALYDRPFRIEIGDGVWRRVDAGRDRIEAILGRDVPIYGVNTGFGSLCQRKIAPDALETLQENLILSHAVGVGVPAPASIVRLMLLLKIQALGLGASGVRREVIASLSRLLCADLLPVIPTQGSLGASGDLAPLAHMVLPMLGRGDVTLDGRRISALQGLDSIGLAPLKLAAKEGLALINGTQFMTAYGCAIWVRARRLLKHADLIAAMSLEGLQGSLRPFDERLHRLRPHPGAIETAANVRRIMADSEILLSHADCNKVQDPYSLRCVPQVHGASRDALRHLSGVMEVEINSVTDNPIIMEDGTTVSGGNFHGQPLALALDYAGIALAELASISERRIYLLLSGHDGLPPLLMNDTGVNSGFMLPQYTAAALVSENKVLAHPASVDSIPTSLGQEDHVSMGATAATKCWQILENAETVLAIEQMCAAQALDFRVPVRPGRGVNIAHTEIRKVIAHAERDRIYGQDIQESLALLRAQTLILAVETDLGPLV